MISEVLLRQDRVGQLDRTEQNRAGRDRTEQSRRGQDRTGQDMMLLYRLSY